MRSFFLLTVAISTAPVTAVRLHSTKAEAKKSSSPSPLFPTSLVSSAGVWGRGDSIPIKPHSVGSRFKWGKANSLAMLPANELQ